MMIEINKKLISELFDKAVVNPRLRQNFDLRNTDDNGQRILNALMPGTVVPIHRHPNSNESVIILCGKLIEITYDNDDDGDNDDDNDDDNVNDSDSENDNDNDNTLAITIAITITIAMTIT